MRRLSVFLVLVLSILFIAVLAVPAALADCPSGQTCLWFPIVYKTDSSAAGEWVTSFANFQRTGSQDEPEVAALAFNGLQLDWSRNLSYQIPSGGSSPVVLMTGSDSGELFYPDGGNLRGMDLETGQALTVSWQATARDATVQGNTIYYTGRLDGWDVVIAADRRTGEIIWTYQMFDPAFGAPTLHGGTLYILSTDRNIYALNAATGTLKWKYLTSSRFLYQTAALQGDVLYAKNEDDALYALNAETGSLIWKYDDLQGFTYMSPAVVGGRVVMVDIWSVRAISTTTGLLEWSFDPRQAGYPVHQFYYGAPAVFGNTVYVHALHDNTGNSSRVFALDLQTGALIWQHPVSATIESSIAIAKSTIFFGANDNKIYGLDARTGDEVWSYETGYRVRSFPAVAGNRLLIASDDRKLYAFKFQ